MSGHGSCVAAVRRPWARRTASSTMRCATTETLTCSVWLILRSRSNASSELTPVRPRMRPTACSMTGRPASACRLARRPEGLPDDGQGGRPDGRSREVVHRVGRAGDVAVDVVRQGDRDGVAGRNRGGRQGRQLHVGADEFVQAVVPVINPRPQLGTARRRVDDVLLPAIGVARRGVPIELHAPAVVGADEFGVDADLHREPEDRVPTLLEKIIGVAGQDGENDVDVHVQRRGVATVVGRELEGDVVCRSGDGADDAAHGQPHVDERLRGHGQPDASRSEGGRTTGLEGKSAGDVLHRGRGEADQHRLGLTRIDPAGDQRTGLRFDLNGSK